MSYNPIDRGPFPVGVRTFAIVDKNREQKTGGRPLMVEVWYPASGEHTGRDLHPDSQDQYHLDGFRGITRPQQAVRDAGPDASAKHPLLVFSHGNSAMRSQSTFYTTHLASHGYVVVAPDHTSNTLAAHMRMKPKEIHRVQIDAAYFRPDDVVFLLDEALDLRTELGAFVAPLVDAEKIGISGHSYGGYTTIVSSARDRRIRAAVPLAPVGIFGPDDFNPLETPNLYANRLDYGRDVPTLLIAAERDALCLLSGIRRLVAEMPVTVSLAVIADTDHMHFCDDGLNMHRLAARMVGMLFGGMRAPKLSPPDELAEIETVEPCVRSLAVAHFDAVLKGHEPARDWLELEQFFALLDADVRLDIKKRGIL